VRRSVAQRYRIAFFLPIPALPSGFDLCGESRHNGGRPQSPPPLPAPHVPRGHALLDEVTGRIIRPRRAASSRVRLVRRLATPACRGGPSDTPNATALVARGVPASGGQSERRNNVTRAISSAPRPRPFAGQVRARADRSAQAGGNLSAISLMWRRSPPGRGADMDALTPAGSPDDPDAAARAIVLLWGNFAG